MKLLYCTECGDVVGLRPDMERVCACGASRGRYYEDRLHAWISGPAVPIGFANHSFEDALQNRPPPGQRGREFKAFVIERECRTVEEQGLKRLPADRKPRA
jgi:hypothetical protein